MKKMFLTLALVLIGVFAFANNEPNLKVNDFLSNYYSSYNFGRSIEIKKDNLNIIISEIINTDNGSINGYIAVRKENNELLYFVDYIRDRKEIKIIDFLSNQTDTIKFVKVLEFENFVNLDLLKEIGKINNDSNNIYRKFWGKECGPEWYTPTGECYKSCTHYVFWIENGTSLEGC